MTSKNGQAFALKDWLQLLLAIAAVFSVVISAIGFVFLQWSEWRGLPDLVRDQNAQLVEQGLKISAIGDLVGAGRPRVILFQGGGIVAQKTVQQGGTIVITYVLRRTIDCRTDITVRFYNHDTNLYAPQTYEIPAIRAQVSTTFAPFPFSVRIPDDLPPGSYSYLPEISPEQCGVYRQITPPMSEAFDVIERTRP